MTTLTLACYWIHARLRLFSCGLGYAPASPIYPVSRNRLLRRAPPSLKTACGALCRPLPTMLPWMVPRAWRKQFADSPSFFMAADGQMVFPDSAAATKGIQDLALDIKQIELVWGNDLRVDPLMPDLAVVAVSYHEVRVNTSGLRVEDAGFFTGIAEYRNGRWQLRDAHWSVAAPPPAAPPAGLKMKSPVTGICFATRLEGYLT